ncbi:hypothetical protein GCM10020000_79630 [Streptomyces olivoverticillatus]
MVVRRPIRSASRPPASREGIVASPKAALTSPAVVRLAPWSVRISVVRKGSEKGPEPVDDPGE